MLAQRSSGLASRGMLNKHLMRVPHVATACRVPAHEQHLLVSKAAADDSETTPADVVRDVQVSCEKFLQRYEQSMLSAGIGAAAVTTWCMVHGQSPGEAAAITVVSTITALVLNEVLFNDQPSQ